MDYLHPKYQRRILLDEIDNYEKDENLKTHLELEIVKKGYKTI